jgi:DNA polymerase (family 10)
MVNAEIAAQFDKSADLLDIEGANPFRVRAYRHAARLVQGLPHTVGDMLAADEDLDALPGIGPDLAGKIATIARGGRLPLPQEVEREIPAGTVALLSIPGLGPKRVHALHAELGIDSPEKPAATARDGKLRAVPGFGAGLEQTLLRALAEGAGQQARTRLTVAEQVAAPLLAWLRGAQGVAQAELAGSFRHRRETVGHLDIVAEAATAGPEMERFTDYEDVACVVGRGPTRSTVVLRGGLQVDLRVVSASGFGAALG